MTKISAIQMNSSDNVAENLAAAKTLLEQAAQEGAKIAVLPEMFAIMGKVETDKVDVQEEAGQGPIQDFLSDTAKQLGIWIIAGTIPIKSTETKKIYAACLVYNDQGQCAARYDKMHLFDASLEHANETYRESDSTVAGHKVIVVNTPFGNIGLTVCYDLRFPTLFRCLLKKGAEIIAVPSAFTAATGKAHWEVLLRARAVENQCYIVGSNQVGVHASQRATYGHSMIIDPWGDVEGCLDDGTGVVTSEINLEKLHQHRKKMPIQQHMKIYSE